MSIYLTDRKIKKLEPIKYCSVGCFGNVYYYGNDALKLIRNPRSHDLPSDLEENMKDLCNVKSYGVGLPKDLVYNNMGFKGSTMEYFPGRNLEFYLYKIFDGNLKIEEQKIDKLVDSFVTKVIDLSNKKILIHDIRPQNLIIVNNDIKIVDCDFYKRDLKKSKDNVYYNNKSQIKTDILDFKTYDDEFYNEVCKKVIKKL